MKKSFHRNIADWIAKGYPGGELAKRYSDFIDEFITRLFRKTAGENELLLLAVGGYGRRELSPYSDIDLMFIAPDRENAGKTEQLLYDLWDTGLDISHSFRTPTECIEEAFKDIRTRTTLLEARYLAGDRVLYDLYTREVYPAVAYRRQKSFVQDKLKEMGRRRNEAGDSVFLLEPHVKEGQGGLRDIHAAFWLSKVAFRVKDYEDLSTFLAPHDWHRFMHARDFLLRTRFCLHMETGRRNDILSFEYQPAIAQRLGFRDSKKFSGAERMLRYYYLQAGIIRAMTDRIIARCGRQYAPVFHEIGIQRLKDGFLLAAGRLISSHERKLSEDPELIMEGFLQFARTGRPFSEKMREDIREGLLRINKKTRSSSRAVHAFVEILRSDRIYQTLRAMHETGVLSRFLPEFGALHSLVVHEPYHLYTVDEHTLMAIRNLELLKTTTVKKLQVLQQIMQRVSSQESLFLALLLHDIGKSSGKHHEEEGYKALKNTLERFQLDVKKRARIEFLVRHHVRMSRIALTREVEDPAVIASFAETVGDQENLDALYLLTYADMSAVNPTFWTSWKAYLLKELYMRTGEHLAGRSRRQRERRVFDADDAIKRFYEDMPERYMLAVTDEKLHADFRIYSRAKKEGFACRIDSHIDGITEISICTLDSEGLFARLIGFLSSKGLNIVRGLIFTGRSGIVLDTIAVSNWQDIWWDGLDAEIAKGLERAATDSTYLPQRRDAPKPRSPFRTFLELDNESLDDCSVLEMFSPDRIGLLFRVARTMTVCGVNIIAARITTESGLAQDVFYVQSGHKKVDNTEAQELLAALWNVLSE